MIPRDDGDPARGLAVGILAAAVIWLIAAGLGALVVITGGR